MTRLVQERIVKPLSGWPSSQAVQLVVPSDKSLSHRALLLAALAQGDSELFNVSPAQDVQHTLSCLRRLGVSFTPLSDSSASASGCSSTAGRSWHVRGCGGRPRSAGSSSEPLLLDCGNSGTTMRLLAGILAGLGGAYCLVGDASLCTRPMGRIIEPLRLMGAEISAQDAQGHAPLWIGCRPSSLDSPLASLASAAIGGLQGIEYTLPVASAQVKSCLLLAGLWAQGQTVVREIGPGLSRDHTERLLRHLGLPVQIKEDTSGGRTITVSPAGLLPFSFTVPGDPSAAAFWLTLAVLYPGAKVVIPGVGLNPGRLGFVHLLQQMGAQVACHVEGESLGEPWGRLEASYSLPTLHGITVSGTQVPATIDELPLLVLVASRAQGETIIRGAQELRHKESDRIATTVSELRSLGVGLEELTDGFRVYGREAGALTGGQVRCFGDHRLEMLLAIAGLLSSEPVVLVDSGFAAISYLDFWETLEGLRKTRKQMPAPDY